MKFIHLTDPHFAPRGKKLYGRDPLPAFDAAVADINAHHGDAEVVVVTGDLTHWGDAEAYNNLAEALAPLTPPIALLIGNHDDRETFKRCFPGHGCDQAGFVQSFLATSAGVFLFLDTVVAGTDAGDYCDARCAWLEEMLKETARRDVFLFMHHPPFETGIAAMDRVSLRSSEAFRQIVEPHKARIRHIFYGHVHRPMAGSWLGIPFSTLRGTNHQVWFDLQAENTQGSFEPPAYCVVLVDDNSVVVHYHDYLDASPKFELGDSPWDDLSRRPPGV